MFGKRASWIALALTLFSAGCQNALEQRVETALFNPDQVGIRWGLVVADMDGNERLAMRAEDRFTPASNTKIITTMAAYHWLDKLESPAQSPGTRVFVEPDLAGGLPDLVLKGSGDAMLSDGPECDPYCLSDLADQIASLNHPAYDEIIGDDTWFPFERWGVGWSVEDLQYYYGTAVSALSLNDNLVWVDILPAAVPGAPAQISWQAGDAYFDLINQVETVTEEADQAVRVERHPGAESVRVYGTIPVDTDGLSFGLAIDNPAAFAALRLQNLLAERDIETARTSTRYRPLTLADEPPAPDDENTESGSSFLPSAPESDPVATLASAPLRSSLKRISKDSENLHAELVLRRLSRLQGTGSRDYGVAALDRFLSEAGVTPQRINVHGGSGMSIYNRISPRGMVQLLAFAADQPWFDAWLADQPIGGVDGSLKRRFKSTSLEGRVFAKTGTLNGTNALSGVMIAQSGDYLLFSIIANDRPPGTSSAIAEMDAALNAIAAAY